jgi:hypothetical protein
MIREYNFDDLMKKKKNKIVLIFSFQSKSIFEQCSKYYKNEIF